MNYKVEVTSRFKKQAKRLIKKFPSLQSELALLIEALEQNPTQGTEIGNNCYKIRLAISSKGKGKSGGARIISHVYFKGAKVFLLSIYDKSEQAEINDAEILSLIGSLGDVK
jgi:mRNA-degrading endonuclease RelE of RelBE toxin-antitoxin system